MTTHDESDFSKKHPADTAPEPGVLSEIQNRTKDNEIPCAVAFDIAEKTNTSPRDVGIALDMKNIRLTKYAKNMTLGDKALREENMKLASFFFNLARKQKDTPEVREKLNQTLEVSE